MKRITVVVIILMMVAALVLASCVKPAAAPPAKEEVAPPKVEAKVAPPKAELVKVDGGSYRDIFPAPLKLMLDSKDFLLVNVHIPYEGEIRDTDLFIPYNEIESSLSRFPEDRGSKIVVYCRSGAMSAIAAKTLVKSGFTNIWNLDGGMIGWERQGYALVRTAR